MATRKTTTKAKTKSVKRPSTTKSAKKTVAAKTSRGATLQKVTPERLRQLNLASVVLAVLLAAVAGLLMNNTSQQVFTGFLTTDELASSTGAVFVPAVRSLFDLEIRWAVVAILIISAFVPLLAATRNRAQYETSLKQKVMLWRWIDVAVVSALMLEVIALLSGVQDIMTLKLIGGLILVTSLLGWLSEKHQARNAGSGRSEYLLSLFTGILPWVVLAVYAGGTIVHGMVRSPWYVYALYATTLLAFIGYGLNGLMRVRSQQPYETTERNYQLLGIFAKTAFAIILIVGLYKN